MRYSIVNYSALNHEKRIDGEYFSPQYLELTSLLKSKPHIAINDFCFVTDGIHESIKFSELSNVNLLSAKSPKENYFDLSSNGFILSEQHKINPRTTLKINDIIISTVGTIGNCAVVENDILPANCDRHVGIIRIENQYKPYFLSSFLLCKYGKFQTIRESTGNVQLNLFIYKIKEILIPKLNYKFQTLIENICRESSEFRRKSIEMQIQAEEQLLKELSLQNYTPTQTLTYSKNYSEVQKAERFDAEYFQPKYEEIINSIQAYPNGWIRLLDCVVVKDKNHKPDDDKEYKYIELSNIDSNGRITGCTIDVGVSLPTRARRLVKTNNVIVSSVEGSLESIALVDSEYDNSLCSTGFYVLEPNSLNPQTLLVYLKSIAGQMQLKQGCNGTILTAISKGYLGEVVIPNIRDEIQQDIKKLIHKSNTSRNTALKLLEIAKKGVEMAIEQDEDAATKWIDEQVGKFEVEI